MATAGELGALYSTLGKHGLIGNTVAPTVVFGYPAAHESAPALSIIVNSIERLTKWGINVFGITGDPEPGPLSGRVAHLDAGGVAALTGAQPRPGPPVRLAPVSYLLGGTLHGLCVDRIDDAPAHAAALVALVERERLRAWTAATRPVPEPTFVAQHVNGSDSTGVLQFRADREIVAKVGGLDMIRAEVEFITQVNGWMARAGHRALLPELYGVHVEGDQATSLMEAAEPQGLDTLLFTDEEQTTLRDDAVDVLEPYLRPLEAWYRLTAEPRPPTVAPYLYGERFHVLPDHPGFVATFAALLPGWDREQTLAAPVLLPGGERVPGYRDALAWLDRVSPALLPAWGSSVHGDIHLKNILHRRDGSPVLIDPRSAWDGRDRPDIGYGDPVFDLATVLHSVLPMSAVLTAIARGRTGELFDHAPRPPAAGQALDLSGTRLPVHFSPAVSKLEQRLLAAVPVAEEEVVTRTRMYVAAACSLAGWLKFARSLRTRQAWLTTYLYAVWYLMMARRTWGEAR
jgi:phosphotransferase family enzyme